jgi:hypothetical protein
VRWRSTLAFGFVLVAFALVALVAFALVALVAFVLAGIVGAVAAGARVAASGLIPSGVAHSSCSTVAGS